MNDDRPRLHVEEEKKLAARKRENEDEKENEETRELCRCEARVWRWCCVDNRVVRGSLKLRYVRESVLVRGCFGEWVSEKEREDAEKEIK